MKSKKIVSLVAMTAMLAACSQDELVSIAGDAKVDLGNRPVIGNVALGLGDIQTRMELAAGSSLRFDWVNGDQIGAAIVDLPVSTPVSGKNLTSEGGEDYSVLSWTYDEYLANVKKGAKSDVTYEQAGLTAKDFYVTHDYISSNYPYEYKDGSFNTQANLVEGNYVFYAPYNAANLMRKPIKAVLPMEQDCSSTTMKDTKYKQQDAKVSSTVLEQFYKGTIEGFENAPVVLGYQFLAAPTDGSVIRPKVEMNQLYAFPMITVKNEFTGRLYGETNDDKSKPGDADGVTMTIDSIQIYHDTKSTNNIFYTALTKAGQIATELAKDGEWGGKRFTKGAPTADLLANFETEYLHHKATNAIKLGVANTALANKANRVTCVIGKELKKGEDYHFHAILPAADYGKDLKARVFVTIGEKQYVIAKADVADKTFVTSNWADFTFEDKVNGGQNCVLIRGEHYPQAEFQQDGNGTKSFAGNMMTLVLGKGTAAFELDDHATAPVVDNGLKTNTDLINYLVNNVQRGVSIAEIVALRGVEQANWKTYEEKDVVVPAAGNLAFSKDNTIIINAELVAALAQQVYVKGDETFTLATNLPVANDVKLSVNGDVYTYTTLGETPVSFAFTMTGVTMGNTATALVAGINKIGESNQTSAVTATLALAENAKDAVVVLAGKTGSETTVTVNNGGAGINAIYVNANTKLVVSGKACNALIIANGGVIELQAGASLTNKNNEFAASVVITNNIAGVIEGKIAEGATVAATYGASWPTAKIAATSRINTVTINLSTANANFKIEQAQMDIFSNLTDGVALTLGANIQGITSDSNVELTNLTALTAVGNIEWVTSSNTGIIVSHKGATIDSKITMGTNVTFEDTTAN